MKRSITAALALLFYASIQPWSAGAVSPKGRFSTVVTEGSPVNVLAHIPNNLHVAIAAGTDNTNLSAYVQAAANAAAGGTLYFPKGVYSVDNIVLSRGTIVQGDGAKYRGPCQVRSRSNNSSVFLIQAPNQMITIRDINIEGPIDPTTGTGRSGIRFAGTVATGELMRYLIQNVYIRGFNRGISIEATDLSSWMLDTLTIRDSALQENIVGMYMYAGNATNITIQNVQNGVWPTATAKGFHFPQYGTVSFYDTWVGANSTVAGSIGFDIGIGAALTFVNCGTEGPEIGINYTGGGGVSVRNPITLIGGRWGKIQIRASNSFSSIGNWFYDNVVFSDYATDAVWYSMGDTFRAGNDFRPYVNSYVHSSRRRFLNASGSSSPAVATANKVYRGANYITLNQGPPGVYRFSVAMHVAVNNTTVSCSPYWVDINGGGQKSKEIFGSVYSAGEYSATLTVGHAQASNLSLYCSADIDNSAYLTGAIEIIAPTAGYSGYW